MSWSCDDTAQCLQGEAGELPEIAAPHLNSCEVCEALVDAHFEISLPLPTVGEQATAGEVVASSEMTIGWSSLSTNLAADRSGSSRLRSLPTSQVALGLVALALTPVLLQAAASLRADHSVYPVARWFIDGVTLGLSLTGLTLVAGWPAHKKQPSFLAKTQSWHWFFAGGVGLMLPFILALLGPAHLSHPESLPVASDEFFSRVSACFRYGAALSAPLLGFFLLTRRTDPVALERVVLITSAFGLLGNWLLAVHCPLTGVAHLLWGHAPLGIVITLLAAALLFLRRRRAASAKA